MPGPAGCCGWRSHMADPALAGGARVRLHRGNVAVVIPALNEALRIREVVLDARAHCEHVILVADGSDDGTPGSIHYLALPVPRPPPRLCPSAHLRRGFPQDPRSDPPGRVTNAAE